MDDEDMEFAQVFWSLDWKEEGVHVLSNSHSKLTLPSGYRLLIGEETKKYSEIDDFIGSEGTEAIVFDDTFLQPLVFEYCDIGFVSIHNPDLFNPDQFLQELSRYLPQNGVGSIRYFRKPVIDKERKTIIHSVEIKNLDDIFILTTAYQLGKKGFMQIQTIGAKENELQFYNHLQAILKRHTFAPGYRYEDHR